MTTGMKFESKQWDTYTKKLENFGDSNVKREPIYLLRLGFSTAGFKDIIRHFRDEKGPTGKWPPRAKSTQEFYASMSKTNAKYNPSNKLLQMTGQLRNSLLPTNLKRKNREQLVFFSTDKKSGVHDRGYKHIPKRSFMWVSKKAKELMSKIILKSWAGK